MTLYLPPADLAGNNEIDHEDVAGERPAIDDEAPPIIRTHYFGLGVEAARINLSAAEAGR